MAGRHRLYNTVEEMQTAIDKYFADCAETKEPLTITGLCLALGFTTRQAFLNYDGYFDFDGVSFLDTIKKAKMKIEQAYEIRNIARGNGGDIFALKQFDWTDKQTVEHSGEMIINNPLSGLTLDELRKLAAKGE